MNILSVRGLTKSYRGGTQALNNINLDIQTSDFVAVIGLSGAGKSTLLRCLNGLIQPSHGEILFRDKPLKSRQKIAMIFQQFNLIPRFSVLTNVLTGRLASTPTWKSIFGLFSAQDREDALHYLKMVGLQGRESARADQLSGGQQQRVAIARALLQNPEVLLADEPVASLDPATARTIMAQLKKVNTELGITVVTSLHYLPLVREFATRVVALKDGGIVYQGPTQDINEEWFKKIYGVDSQAAYVR